MITQKIKSIMINKQCVLKTIVYRLYSSMIVFLIALLITGNLFISFSIGLVESLIKLFSYYFFDEVWTKLTGFRANPAVVWLTGLSEQRKTTIAKELAERLKRRGVVPVTLFGNEIRKSKANALDNDSNKLHTLDVGYLATLFKNQGNIVIVSLISPDEEARNEIRKMCTDFIEVSVSTDIEIFNERVSERVNEKTMSGKTKGFDGVHELYFPTNNSEIILDTDTVSIHVCVDKILKILKKRYRIVEKPLSKYPSATKGGRS